MPCEYGPAAAGALSVAINSCALTVVEILCFFIWCFLAADSAHKLRAVMDDDWYACMMSRVDNRSGEEDTSYVFSSFWVLKCLACVMRARRDQRKKNEQPLRATNETTTREHKQKRTARHTFCVFLPSRGRQSAMILVIFVSALHAHTHAQREEYFERSETNTRWKSLVK